MDDFNLGLVIVAVVVCVLVLLVNFYIHAYFLKFVVILGLSISAISIFMLPANVANRQACCSAICNGACSLTLPMETIWLFVYITNAVLVFLVIPFTMFYYEANQDKSTGKRLMSALMWVIASAIICMLILGILYGLLGTAAFALFYFYLLLAVIAGEIMLGLQLVIITIHPMNVIQFSATAFGSYAQATAAQDIVGHTIQSLRGIKYLYKCNMFQIAFIGFAFLTLLYYVLFVSSTHR
ncbi:LMBR1-like membrane protein [Dioscorea alata]|uniref:LMBR1-like membrane protein n=1 Tax=Dioscorea alata TaxID=55571 RepID=A0ACB7U792_DIOAL|nr:LMBR1-like membrane protein [Dioscorea alata]